MTERPFPPMPRYQPSTSLVFSALQGDLYLAVDDDVPPLGRLAIGDEERIFERGMLAGRVALRLDSPLLGDYPQGFEVRIVALLVPDETARGMQS